MPVLPEVASTIVPPGFRRPSRSAASTMPSAMRSLIDPPGLNSSSLANSRQGPVSRLRNSTIGVLPMAASIEAPFPAPALRVVRFVHAVPFGADRSSRPAMPQCAAPFDRLRTGFRYAPPFDEGRGYSG